MTGVQVVLGAFAGAALAVAITILRGWLVNRFAGPWPADPAHTFAAQMSTQRQCRGEHRGMSTPRVPLRADVLEAERRAVQHSPRPARADGSDAMTGHAGPRLGPLRDPRWVVASC